MTHNNNFNPLPWYTSLDQQNHRKSYAYGEIYPLFALANFMLPWQVQRPHKSGGVTSFKIYHEDGTLWRNVLSAAQNNISIVNNSYVDPYTGETVSYDNIVFTNVFPLYNNQPDGRYYAIMSDGTNTWYSEVYTVVQSLDSYLKIEWYDVADLVYEGGRIVYGNVGYHNSVALIAELGKPEYTFEDIGEDRDGFWFPEKQLSEKTYRFTFLAPEYMCDALRIVRLSDYVIITDQFGVQYRPDKFLMTPKWLQNGDLASVTVEFQTDTVVKKIGQGVTSAPSGNEDFNNDFNNDFLIDN